MRESVLRGANNASIDRERPPSDHQMATASTQNHPCAVSPRLDVESKLYMRRHGRALAPVDRASVQLLLPINMGLLAIPELNTRLGTFRAYHLADIVFISSFLSAYDSGIAGGILTYKSFQNDFGFTAAQKSKVSSLTVGLEQLGSFVAAMFFYPLTNKYGRKVCIVGSTALFVIGVIIQVINIHPLAAWYVGRIVSGLSMGGQSVVIPMYSAEMTPKDIRGRCGSFYQWLYAWGVFLAYGVDYNCTDDSWNSIIWIRGGDGPKTRDEFTETQLGLQAEKSERETFSYRELLEPANRLRFIIGPVLFIFQNATGSSALAVFAPQYFKLIAGSDSNRNMLLTGLLVLSSGSELMAICMLITTLIVDYIPTQSSTNVTAAGRATVTMIYLDIMIYNCANTFLIFMGFDVLATVFCWFFVKETRGKNLEVAAGTEWEAAERSSSDDAIVRWGHRSELLVA
ncbi:hypothetical protein N7532_004276 [Penicillium argentinense]|uniref:Major facilitator superfamily (MFS) profile domain-containing protein n=1 Tax=Penicillium argentinense TaxID=1131581 RepID=A0A9W9FPN1_9EURO|nr:uncharacterized protein N7532_004276 [Penicillium argentinense]KAJ5103747.1 hypothetical protein N7532_004276 [Penicillium argentinense]